MPDFVKGLDLCEGFFHEVVKPIVDREFPDLRYDAAWIGAGSEILGCDDLTSTDHHWGLRAMLFVGGIDQQSDSTDVLSRPEGARRLKNLYQKR
ncbi:MAG: hypothetical protein OHK0023_00580 [Anaerolineae bacterium]